MSASAANLFGGQEFANYWGYAYILVSVMVAGGVVGSMRGVETKNDTHAFIALAIGGLLIGALIYVATFHVPMAPH
jgi:hypothetical protein